MVHDNTDRFVDAWRSVTKHGQPLVASKRHFPTRKASVITGYGRAGHRVWGRSPRFVLYGLVYTESAGASTIGSPS